MLIDGERFIDAIISGLIIAIKKGVVTAHDDHLDEDLMLALLEDHREIEKKNLRDFAVDIKSLAEIETAIEYFESLYRKLKITKVASWGCLSDLKSNANLLRWVLNKVQDETYPGSTWDSKIFTPEKKEV